MQKVLWWLFFILLSLNAIAQKKGAILIGISTGISQQTNNSFAQAHLAFGYEHKNRIMFLNEINVTKIVSPRLYIKSSIQIVRQSTVVRNINYPYVKTHYTNRFIAFPVQILYNSRPKRATLFGSIGFTASLYNSTRSKGIIPNLLNTTLDVNNAGAESSFSLLTPYENTFKAAKSFKEKFYVGYTIGTGVRYNLKKNFISFEIAFSEIIISNNQKNTFQNGKYRLTPLLHFQIGYSIAFCKQ